MTQEIKVRSARFSGSESEPNRAAWCGWFERHGIDPSDVADPGWVEVDDRTRTITFWGFVRDEHGKDIVIGDSFAKAAMFVQCGEAVAPFPVPASESHEPRPYTRRSPAP